MSDHIKRVISEHLKQKELYKTGDLHADLIAQLQRAKIKLNKSVAGVVPEHLKKQSNRVINNSLKSIYIKKFMKDNNIDKDTMYSLLEDYLTSGQKISLPDYLKNSIEPRKVNHSRFITEEELRESAKRYDERKAAEQFHTTLKNKVKENDMKHIIKACLNQLKHPVISANESLVNSLQNQYDNIINQIQNMNKRLDNKSLSQDQKDSIHDLLDRLKDRRKETSLKLSDAKLKAK